MTLLIFGARKKSIGHMIKNMWGDMFDEPAVTAGISGEEYHAVDYHDQIGLRDLIAMVEPTRIVCTVGMNQSLEEHGGDMRMWVDDHLHVNVTIPMMILEAWMDVGVPAGGHFVAISSNSAHIPRSQSLAYGASKAALSMAIRCAARDVGKAKMPMVIYGWEPGLVRGTPMTGRRGGTRMLGLPGGLPRRALATQIVNALAFGGAEYNGVLIRLDAGEV